MTDRAPLPYAWDDIRHRLQASLATVLGALNLRDELTADGRGAGGVICPRNPTRDDRKAGSFVIWTQAPAIGAWKDFACGDTDKGDVFDLIGYVEGLARPIDCYWRALDILGLDRRGSTDTPRRKAADQLDRERRARDAAAEAEKNRESEAARSAALFKLWLSLPASIEGTIAEAYLRGARGIDLSRLKKPPGALRYAAAVDWVDPQTGEVTEWRHVMVSAMTKGSKLAALHRTYLKPDGSGKADRLKPKLMIGPVRGSAIRLAPGPSGLSPAAAAKAGRRDPLAIGEGIETALTVACARPDYRVWAAGSLSLMGLLDWPACASAVVLLRDNDWKPEARKAFDAALAHWSRQAEGRPLVVAESAVGNDFNDMVRKAG